MSPLTLQGLDPLNAEQATEIFQLATECQTLGSELAKQFQTLCRLEASHHVAAQATTHEIILSGHQAHSTAYGVAAATQQAEQQELTLCRLHEEAIKAWKDANDIIFSHLLKYDSELEAMNCSPQTGLSMALQTLHWLPNIPWHLSYHMGVPMMFAYGPELYELQTLGATGDGGFHLDNHAWAANLLSHKLAHIHGRAGSDRASPSRVASPTSSAAPHSSMSLPARSYSRTPPHGTSLVRSHSHSASSTSSHAAAPGSLAGSGGEGHEDSKSTSEDGSETNNKSMAGSDDKAPGDDEHKAGEGSNIANSSSDVEEAKRSGDEVDGSTSQGSQSSFESDGEMPVHAAMPSKETGKNTATKEAKTSAPSSSKPPPHTDSKVTKAEQKCQ